MDRTFEQLWNEAYVANLALRKQNSIFLTENQKQLLKGTKLNSIQQAWVDKHSTCQKEIK